MAKKLYEEASVQAIADAIRAKNGGTAAYKIGEMAAAVQAIPGAEAVAWHQCPEAVRNYLAAVTYDAGDYTVSHIASYAPGTGTAANCRPVGVTRGGTTYYNETPNILTPFASGGKAGTLRPLDALRWIHTPQAVNVRDLGGWACDGGTVRYGRLFRGGEITAADRDVLVGECGVRAELNLRGRNEADYTPPEASPLGADILYAVPRAYQWYTIADKAAWQESLRFVFDSVAHNRPVYFHCAAGADRTGTLACVLEALLGVSQSDIDKDYELTSFWSGTATDTAARRRNEPEWTGLIGEISALTGSTFRDKAVGFAASLGFTAAEINAFRAAMIDGTPETVTPSVSTYSVTHALSHAVTNNAAAQATEYQPYTAAITAAEGYAIGSVQVKMGGTDITADVFRGTKVNRLLSVTWALTGCTIGNLRKTVIAGQDYAAAIAAAAGYTLAGAAVSIKMGGVEMSTTYYKDGVIAIPNVTGDLEITVTAVSSAVENLFDFDTAVGGYLTNGTSTFNPGSTNHVVKDTDAQALVTKTVRSASVYLWTCPSLAELPAGNYVFSGEFKQDAVSESGIAVYLGATRLIKNSLKPGGTWTAFSYAFTLSAPGTVYIEGQNDSAQSDGTNNNAYLRNVRIVAA